MTEERTARMSSVLGETGVVIGNVDGVGDLEIRGRVQGSVSLSGRVLIAETGTVIGNVQATHIAVAGEVRGDLCAKDGVEVQAQGRVEGNVEAPRVGIEAGARVRGMLRTGGELLSSKQEEVAQPLDVPVSKNAQPQPQESGRKKEFRRPRRDTREAKAARSERTPHTESGRSEGERKDNGERARSDQPLASASSEKTRKLKPTRSADDARGPEEKPRKARRKKGAPPPPTFVKGARGRAK